MVVQEAVHDLAALLLRPAARKSPHGGCNSARLRTCGLYPSGAGCLFPAVQNSAGCGLPPFCLLGHSPRPISQVHMRGFGPLTILHNNRKNRLRLRRCPQRRCACARARAIFLRAGFAWEGLHGRLLLEILATHDFACCARGNDVLLRDPNVVCGTNQSCRVWHESILEIASMIPRTDLCGIGWLVARPDAPERYNARAFVDGSALCQSSAHPWWS